MLNSASLHSQLTSIMDVLTKAAVAEICKLVDDGYALLRLEMSRSQKENEALKRKLSLRMMEADPAGTCGAAARIPGEQSSARLDGPHPPDGAGEAASVNAFLNHPLEVCRGGEPAARAKKDFRLPSDPGLKKCSEVEKRRESLNIKEERFEEDMKHCDSQIGLMISVGRVVEPAVDDPGDGISVPDKIATAVDDRQALSEHQRPGAATWSDGGFLTVLKADPENETISRKSHIGRPEGDAGKPFETVMCERPSPLETFFTQVRPEPKTEQTVRAYAHSERHLSTLGPFPETSGNTSSSLGSRDEKLDVVITDSELQQSSVWAREITLGAVQVPQKQSSDRGKSVRPQQGSYVKVCSPQTRMSERDKPSKSFDGPGMSGCSVNEENPTTTRSVHQRGSTREKRFICAYCGKSFTCLKNLETHKRVHTGERPFSCAQCGKRFSQSAHLKKHQSVHTGEKPFRCTKCGKCFADSSNLKRHQNVHTGERPFCCTQCDKRFSLIANLKRHQSIHIAKKPYRNIMWEGLIF
ncbi:zinc finger protein 260-like isoform X2 [Brienomyrus brachyistius]|uniref:zinc finger protein 260-like isoform X2 n=1 Tax=Brienomyrus brachyistius TaxID=42636 RepID=UPI0020B2E8F5|nr:zinc finger protein 260-like isoform X2 [Brienomyrus brachyistius]